MSPAFINRFDVIVFENQLEGLSDNDLSSFIKFLLNNIKYQNILYKNLYGDEENEISEEATKKLDSVDKEEEVINPNPSQLSRTNSDLENLINPNIKRDDEENSEDEEFSDTKSDTTNKISNKENEENFEPELIDLIVKNFDKNKNTVSYLYLLCKSEKK